MQCKGRTPSHCVCLGSFGGVIHWNHHFDVHAQDVKPFLLVLLVFRTQLMLYTHADEHKSVLNTARIMVC